MRVFAGPNGSGKTTIIKTLQDRINYGIYVNADEIEKTLAEKRVINFDQFNLKLDREHLQDFFKNSKFSPVKRNEPDIYKKLQVDNNNLIAETIIDSYLAADLAEYIRQYLLHAGYSFTYETVMSHPSKIDFMHKAKLAGYRVYLYFIATVDPEININRVNVRISQDGHSVPDSIVRSRYYKSLSQLSAAIKYSNRAYLWDNSSAAATMFAEITEGTDVQIIEGETPPVWFTENITFNPNL